MAPDDAVEPDELKQEAAEAWNALMSDPVMVLSLMLASAKSARWIAGFDWPPDASSIGRWVARIQARDGSTFTMELRRDVD